MEQVLSVRNDVRSQSGPRFYRRVDDGERLKLYFESLTLDRMMGRTAFPREVYGFVELGPEGQTADGSP